MGAVYDKVLDSGGDDNEFEVQIVRYKPEAIDSLCEKSKFSRKELQIMYRGFKQECPTGIVDEDTFKEIYSRFFHRVILIRMHIIFEEFVVGLSVLARGTMTERLEWAFNLYDINGDGLITREEMLNIISAIYELMGRFCEPSVYENTTRDHVEMVFKKMDLNKDGVISLDEFMDSCRKDENITKGMSMFDTVL
ncbi:Calsenilin,Kv channel-interacting protein 1,Kv channel-interacting protein 2,Kv channel-interacting protein 4 [Mytilus edulis]|uniref:Calsenilin,Kv channel-interacting protein 1,Kv channel-interacting protein 2,Kv channel-interacting protein 4 n=1 Tax=Mytilus edulis TaxID=6550 RepID=A0A8S3VCS3_MYTED|nr:Calsenilin,Kv channel-interacting protein 1,Kv channel-interacting protein 2,Kv channel-interacting protein 4 [Mytilus edulis]